MRQRQIDDDAPEEFPPEPRAPMRTGIRLSAYPQPDEDMPERAASPHVRAPRDVRRKHHR